MCSKRRKRKRKAVDLDVVGNQDVKIRGEGNKKKAHMKNTRKIRKYNKMDARNENIQNNVNEHETNKSEKTYVEEHAVRIFF
jgi:hypothetical protein